MTIQMGFGSDDFGMKTWRAVAAEFIATGMFVFLGTGTVVAMLNVLGGGPVTNPAFVTAVAIAHGLGILIAVSVAANISGGHWIYWLGPLIGAALAGLVYQFVFLEGNEGDSADAA